MFTRWKVGDVHFVLTFYNVNEQHLRVGYGNVRLATGRPCNVLMGTETFITPLYLGFKNVKGEEKYMMSDYFSNKLRNSMGDRNIDAY